jgi:hypothetical protein
VKFGDWRGVVSHWHLSPGVSGVTLAFWLGLRVSGFNRIILFHRACLGGSTPASPTCWGFRRAGRIRFGLGEAENLLPALLWIMDSHVSDVFPEHTT